MTGFFARLPALIAAPFIAVLALLGGLLALVGLVIFLAAGLVMVVSFLGAAFCFAGFAFTGSTAALAAALKCGLWFVASFPIPFLTGYRLGRFFFPPRPPLRLELERDARFAG